MPRIKYLFVVNPISGGKDKSSFFGFINEKKISENLSCEVFQTTGDKDEILIKELLDLRKPEVIVAVGGDGTLLLVSRIVKNTVIKIGLIPFGSANGMARELHIPKIPDGKLRLNPSQKFRDSWEIIKRERIRQIDLLQINEEFYSLHLSDIGLNAKIVKRFEAEKIRGYFGYARLFFKELKQKKQIKYSLVADGKRYRGKAYMIVIANATMYGTGAVINPIGKLDDGVFEICLIKQLKFAIFLRSLVSIYKKNMQPRKDLMQVVSCKKASIEIQSYETLQVDGEVVNDIKKAEVSIIPKALRIIA